MSKIYYYGQIRCQSSDCKNKAYFKVNNSYYCGIHSRKFKEERVILSKNPNRVEDRKKTIGRSRKNCFKRTKRKSKNGKNWTSNC